MRSWTQTSIAFARLAALACLAIGCGAGGDTASDANGESGSGAGSGSGGEMVGSGQEPFGSGSGSGGDDPFSGGLGNSSGGGGDAGPGPSGDELCGNVSIDTSVEEVVTPGNVLIVFDQSASMDGDFSGQLKWEAASDAVANAIQPLADSLNVGAIFFPTGASLAFVGECDLNSVAPIGGGGQIPFMPGQQFLQAWQQRWQQANLVLGTPLDAGMIRAAEALGNLSLPGQSTVIVVTDGEPTCFNAPPGNSVEIASLWVNNAIQTHVIGLPGAGNVPALTDLASAGGTGDYVLPTDAGALQQKLEQVTSTVVSRSLDDCAIVFNETPEDFDQVALVVTEGETGDKFQVQQGPDGWELAEDGSRATLTGKTCDDALGGRFSNVEFKFGCVDVPVLR